MGLFGEDPVVDLMILDDIKEQEDKEKAETEKQEKFEYLDSGRAYRSSYRSIENDYDNFTMDISHTEFTNEDEEINPSQKKSLSDKIFEIIIYVILFSFVIAIITDPLNLIAIVIYGIFGLVLLAIFIFLMKIV